MHRWGGKGVFLLLLVLPLAGEIGRRAGPGICSGTRKEIQTVKRESEVDDGVTRTQVKGAMDDSAGAACRLLGVGKAASLLSGHI